MKIVAHTGVVKPCWFVLTPKFSMLTTQFSTVNQFMQISFMRLVNFIVSRPAALLMASLTCHPSAFYQEPSFMKLPKSSKIEIPNYGWPHSKLLHGEPLKTTFMLPESTPFVRISPTSFVLPGNIESSLSFSEITRISNSDLDLPLRMDNSVGNSCVNYISKLHPSYSQNDFHVPLTLTELDDRKECYEFLMLAYPNWEVMKFKSENDFEDFISSFSELYMPKRAIRCDRNAMIVPYFDRSRLMKKKSQDFASPVDFEDVIDMESSTKLNFSSAPTKKQGRNAAKKRSLVEKNYFHAFECLVLLLLNPYRNDTLTILSIKTSPNLPKLLDKFTTWIAGSGIAVIFYVICKVAGGIVPFRATKLMHAGFGLGLIWLSWSVNGLRNVITEIIYKPSKTGYGESLMMKRMNRSVNDIFLRALALMTVSVLTYA